ncbi:MAG: hypothetical protein AABX89_06150 [Candidatus Thermoplasmatota archaeon]
MVRALLPVLAIVALLLSGCAGPTSSARSLLAAAQSEADDWSSDARLVNVVGIEVSNGTELRKELEDEGEIDDTEFVLADDERTGDGLAAAWGYTFTSERLGKLLGLVLDGSGDILVRSERPLSNRGSDPPIDLDAWRIDSDEAWSLLPITTDGKRPAASVLTQDDKLGGGQFFPQGNHPYWILLFGDEFDNASLFFVNAFNGTVVNLKDLLEQIILDFAVSEYGSEAGRATVLDGTVTHRFTLQQNHTKLAIAVTPDLTTLPTQTGTLTLHRPDGTASQLTVRSRLDAASSRLVLDNAQAGQYEATFTLDAPPAGVLLDYQFSFCTDGFVLLEFFRPDACAALPDGAALPSAMRSVLSRL